MRSRTAVRCATAGTMLVGVVAVVSGCAHSAGAPTLGAPAASRVDGAPFAELARCGDQPFVAVFRGFTAEGERVERAGSSPSSDIYGVRPDGSVSPVTTDLGSYDSGIAADAATVYASPSAAADATLASTPSADRVVAISPATGRQTAVLEAPDVGA